MTVPSRFITPVVASCLLCGAAHVQNSFYQITQSNVVNAQVIDWSQTGGGMVRFTHELISGPAVAGLGNRLILDYT
jgi:hypothetical protein